MEVSVHTGRLLGVDKLLDAFVVAVFHQLLAVCERKEAELRSSADRLNGLAKYLIVPLDFVRSKSVFVEEPGRKHPG